MRRKSLHSPLPVTLCLVVLLLLLTTGCLVNPVTGRSGPSWQVPLSIPLIATELSIEDLLKEVYSPDFAEDVLKSEFSGTSTFSFADVELGLKEEIQIDIDPSSTPDDFVIKTKLMLADLWDKGTLEAVTFQGGTLTISLDGGGSIESISLNGGQTQSGSSLSLNGVTFVSENELTIKLANGGSNVEGVTVTFDEPEIASITGHSFEFTIPAQEFELDSYSPEKEEFEKLTFSNVELSLLVRYKGVGTNTPTLDLRALDVSGLTTPDTAVFSGEGEIVFDSEEATNLLNSRPDQITVTGVLKTGNKSSTIHLSDALEMEYSIVIPFDFVVSEDILAYESKVSSVDMSQASLDGLKDLTTSLRGEVELDYRLPIGAVVDIYLSRSETPASDPDAVHVRVTIDPAPVNEMGRTTTSSKEQIPVELPKETGDLLREGAYAQVRITIPNTANAVVSFTTQDYVKLMAWAELLIAVNK